MLAMLSFLRRLSEFIKYHEPWQGTIATDSLSLIDAIKGVQRDVDGREVHTLLDDYASPLDVPCPDWDVVVHIRRLLHTMPALELQHAIRIATFVTNT